MYRATFTFESETPCTRVITELLGESDNYHKIMVMDNGEEPFLIHYEFSEKEVDGQVIAIGSGSIDSEDGEYGYE
jgi:hypothetical protein